jgi:hypothetical protein
MEFRILIDDLWGAPPPPTARRAVRCCYVELVRRLG